MENRTKICALTFDDGPDNILTKLVLEKLKKYNVPATFFMIGIHVNDSTSAIVKEIIAKGCEIGNHSWDHPYMTNLTESEIKKQIEDTNEVILKYSGTKPKFFRPPYIDVNNTMYNVIDMPFISGISANDWDPLVNTQTRAKLILDNIKDGSIILLHDVQPIPHSTPEALDIIIPELLSQGYEFVTLSELFERKGFPIKPSENKLYLEL